MVYVGNNQVAEYLDLSYNKLKGLTLYSAQLRKLILNNNKLCNIDLQNLPCLTKIDISSNSLTHINLHANPDIEYLSLSYNKLLNIDLTGNLIIKELELGGNKLTNLDLKDFSMLEKLACYGNIWETYTTDSINGRKYLKETEYRLRRLILPHSSRLKSLNCGANLISNLDISKSIHLEEINCNSNSISNLNVKSERIELC